MTPEALAQLARQVYARGHTTSSGGNLSARSGSGFLVSGTGTAFARQVAADFSLCDLSGERLDGPKPSKEARFHAAVYRMRPEVQALIHVHADASLALGCLLEPTHGNALPILSSYAVTKVGRVPLLPYFAPGSDELVEAVAAACGQVNALMLQNHGVLVWAPDAELAFDRLEELEQNARVWLLTQGRCRVLDDAELEVANRTATHMAHVAAGEQRPRPAKEAGGWTT